MPAGSTSRPGNGTLLAAVLSVALGIFLAILPATRGRPPAVWARFVDLVARKDAVSPGLSNDSTQLDRMNPQKQAETLLELAVAHSEAANDLILSRIDRWQGQVKWTSQIAMLTTAALNSSDMRVRESAIEVELVAYGLSKNSASLEYLLKTAASANRPRRAWALWALGLMGNRGVDPDRVVQVLTAHLNDSSEDSRRWSVAGLALVGTTETIEPLLRTMHDDPSPLVREKAACGLADSGMFTREQRLSVVPRLLNYTDDASLDSQTHAWAFQALGDITRQHLPDDPAAWRNWFDSTKSE